MAINNLFVAGTVSGASGPGDFELLVEGGGTFRVSTLNRAPLPLGVLQGQIGGNYDLVTRCGTVLPVVSAAPDGNPPGAFQLSAYAGGTWNVCLLQGGIITLVPNSGGT